MSSRRVQVTCYCTAYDFPHRIDGGKCTGSSWAASYVKISGQTCPSCNCFVQPGECEVANGAESIQYCEAYQDHLHRQPPERYPMSEEEYFDAIARRYFEE